MQLMPQFRTIKENFGVKVFVLFVAVILIVACSFGGFYLSHQRSSISETISREGAYLANILAFSSRVGVFAENDSLLNDPIEAIIQHDGVISAGVFTYSGKRLKTLERQVAGHPPASAGSELDSILTKLRNKPAPRVIESDDTVEFWSPIRTRQGISPDDALYFGSGNQVQHGGVIGFARLVIDKSVYADKFRVLAIDSLLLAGLFLAITSAIVFLVVRGVTTPLMHLREGVAAIGRGESRKVPVETTDEVGQVAVAFNAMVDALEMRETERKLAEERVHTLNGELESRVRKRTLQLEEANRELESFNYSASHDLRAPLMRMEGFCAALLEDCGDRLGDEGLYCVDRIRLASKQMDEIIKAMMSLSRLNRSELQRTEINLSEMVQAVAASFREIEPDRRVELSIQKELRAAGDFRLVWIALENLVGNAWKFSTGQPAPRIEFGTVQDGGRQLFFLRDNGVGFDMRFQEKLFLPFQRLHHPDEFPGTGIGLAIVKKIINRHGGVIRLESEVGKGTSCYFSLE